MGDQPENFPHFNGFHVDENDPLLQDDGGNPEIDIEGPHPVDIQEAAIVAHYADGGQVNIPLLANLVNLEIVAAGSNEPPQVEFFADGNSNADLHNGYTGMLNNSYDHSITSSSGSSTVQDRSEQVIPDVGPESLLLHDKNGHEDENTDDGFESELSDPTENVDVSTHLLNDNNDHPRNFQEQDRQSIEPDEPLSSADSTAQPASSSYENIELLPGNIRVRPTLNQECIVGCFICASATVAFMFMGCLFIAAFFAEGFVAMQVLTWAGIIFIVLITCFILLLIVACYIAKKQKRRRGERR